MSKSKGTEFYITVAPGTENEALQELQEIWGFLLGPDLRPQCEPFPEVRVSHGGLTLNCDLGVGLSLNFWMKTAVRILVRIGSFQATEFYQLEKALLKIPWEKFFSFSKESHIRLSYQVDSQKSKLGQEKKIQEVLAHVLSKVGYQGDLIGVNNKSLKSSANHFSEEIQHPDEQEIYLRGYQDQWMLSLNSSGDFLYKRGWAPFKGEAPVRENLATVGCRMLVDDCAVSDFSKISVIDPFAGSGTLLWELGTLLIPHVFREFAFLKWKNTPAWVQLEKEQIKNKILKGQFESFLSLHRQWNFLALDKSPEAADLLSQNFKKLSEFNINFSFHSMVDDFWSTDFLKLKDKILDRSQIWIFTNPPYGQRISWSQDEKNNWVKRICDLYQPDRFAFIFPQKDFVRLPISSDYKISKKIELKHGGLDVVWVLLQKRILAPTETSLSFGLPNE